MADRPSTLWRDRVAAEARELANGAVARGDAFLAALFPPSLLDATDAALATFDGDLRGLREPSDEDVCAAVERVVLVLNAINDAHGGAGYETGEREELCLYIDQSLVERGVDVAALTARRGLGRYELTDAWRDW